MFNQNFLKDIVGSTELPAYLAWERLFNVSYDLDTEIVKLYFLDETKSFLYKVGPEGISKQFSAEKFNADANRLSAFLGQHFDYDRISLDTVEDDVFYLYLETASLAERNDFLSCVCQRYGIGKDQFVTAANRINARQSANLYECLMNNAVVGIKIPLLNDRCKLYARPFDTGNGYVLGDKAESFLLNLYACQQEELFQRIRYLWVSTEILSGRMVLTTQRHELIHAV